MPADGKVSTAASELTRILQDDERLASVELSGRTQLLVHWFGPVDPGLQEVLDRFPDVDITVKQAACLPKKLRDFGSALLKANPHVRGSGVATDGSRLDLMVDESVERSFDVADLEREYSKAAGCPVTITFGSIKPAL